MHKTVNFIILFIFNVDSAKMANCEGKDKGHQRVLYSSSKQDVSSQSVQQLYQNHGTQFTQQKAQFPPARPQEVQIPLSQPAFQISVVDCIAETRGRRGEDIKCAVCLEVYKDPHLLPCLHSFCKTCLVRLSASYLCNKIKCPTCRKEHSLSLSGVDDLLPNTYLASKVEEVGGSGINLTRSCGQCNSLDIVIFCSQCNDFLCRQCHEAHKRMAVFSEHRDSLLPVSQAKKRQNVKEYKCSQHPKELLQVYCVNCEVVICRDCALYSHHNHQFKPAEKAAAEIKQRLSSSSTSLKEKSKIFQSHTETIAKVEQHVTTYPDQLKASISSTFDELIRALHQRKQTLLNEVDTKYNSFSKVLWAEKDTVEMTLCSLQAGIKFADQLKEDQTNLEVAVLGTQAIKSMKKLHSVSWDSKAINGLGPLFYLRQEKKEPPPKDNLQLINSIGHVIKVDTELTLTAEGYSSADSFNSWFQKNGMYSVTAKYLDIVFPAVTMSAKVLLVGAGIIHSDISKNDDKWKITFHTPKAGIYEVNVQLKRGNETIDKMITIDLKQKYQPVHTYNEYDVYYDYMDD